MYRNLAVAKKIRKKAHREELAKYLLDPGPDVVVCDEGHVMRNSKSNLSIVLGRIKTRTRIVLTGTPLQNNLLECKMFVVCATTVCVQGSTNVVLSLTTCYLAILLTLTTLTEPFALCRLHYGELCEAKSAGDTEGVH